MMEPIRIREKEFPNESFIWLSWHWTYSPCSAFLAPTGQTCSFEGHQSNPIPLFYSLPLYFRFLLGKILVCAFALFALVALFAHFCPFAILLVLPFWLALFALMLFCLLLVEKCFCFILIHCTSII